MFEVNFGTKNSWISSSCQGILVLTLVFIIPSFSYNFLVISPLCRQEMYFFNLKSKLNENNLQMIQIFAVPRLLNENLAGRAT